MTNSLEDGDVFAVIAEEGNIEKVDYYLLQCSRPKTKLLVDTIDDHGDSYERYSVVVYGRYYAKVTNRGKDIHFVQYEWNKEAIMYSHLVIAVKLQLQRVKSKKKTPTWKLSHLDHESILDTLRNREDQV